MITRSAPSRSRRLRPGKAAALIALAVAVVLGAVVADGLYLQRKYDRNVERFGDPFAGIPDRSRPPAASGDARNLLLLGSDSRVSAGDPSQWEVGAQRTDAIMVAHVSADRASAQVVSIPRDSYVDVPGHGKHKINAAFSYGGPRLMVQTVEHLTGVRIDHVVIVDFTGFKTLTDDVGGVTLDGGRMDGTQALAYVRERHSLPGGDFDRVKRHQAWIRAVLTETLNRGVLTNPLKLTRVLDTATKSMATDDGFSIGEMRSLALSARGIRASDMQFATAPVAGTGRVGKAAIVRLDMPANRDLWAAIAADRVRAPRQ